MTQITHEGADDSALADLIGEAKTADEALDFETQERRIKAVELAISSYHFIEHSTDLIAHAHSIEQFILKGYTAPETPAETAPPSSGSRAFVEDEGGVVKEV